MLKARTLKFLALLIAGYLLLLLPGAVWPSYFESPASLLVLVPYLSVSFFHRLGVPGVLEHDGACGWGWCSPTPFGWILTSLPGCWWLGALPGSWRPSHKNIPDLAPLSRGLDPT